MSGKFDIIEATHLESYKVEVIFGDGERHVLDFEPFLKTNEAHPCIAPYLELENFKNFELIDQNLNWGDYEMIFHPEELRKGKIGETLLV